MKGKKNQKLSVVADDALSRSQESGQGVEVVDDFVRIEKDLATLGFFTPTSRGKTGKLKSTRVKTVAFNTRDDEGRAVRKSVRIVTAGDYGLPGTADLDKWLAFMKLVNGLQRARGVVENPICFTSAELLGLLGLRRDGWENYDAVVEWLRRMKATTIEFVGEGGEGKKRSGAAESGMNVFDIRVSKGERLPGGAVADRNFVWLAQWQLDALNRNYVIPIDFEAYRALKKPIAKTLVPLLQVYLYASRFDNVFTKSYEELAQLLGIKVWTRASEIREQIGPSLDELREGGYLAGWGVEAMRKGEGFKVVFRHGQKFHRDLLLQQERHGHLTAVGVESGEESEWLGMLVERGITEAMARKLIQRRGTGQQIGDQIEWIDHMIRKRGVEHYDNPPGFYVALIQTNAPIDPSFETSRMRRARAEYEARRREDEMRAGGPAGVEFDAAPVEEASPRAPNDYELYLLRSRYDEYKRRERARYLGELPSARREEVMEEARKLYGKKYAAASKVLKGEVAEGVMLGIAEEIIEPEVEVISFEDFAAQS